MITSVMINTAIHDRVLAQRLAQAERCRHFDEVLAAADDFVGAATLCLSALSTNADGANSALVDAGSKYGKLLYENDGAFDMSTDTTFACVADLVDSLKASSKGMANKWDSMVDCYVGHDLDDAVAVVVV